MTNGLRNIVCVDDEPSVLAVTQMCLETVGDFYVTAVSSGKEGISTSVAIKPDLILLDVMMPEMDGPTTLQALRQYSNLDDVPIFLMTARVQPHEVKEYLEIGANAVIAKPFDPMALSDQIQTLWEKFHAAR